MLLENVRNTWRKDTVSIGEGHLRWFKERLVSSRKQNQFSSLAPRFRKAAFLVCQEASSRRDGILFAIALLIDVVARLALTTNRIKLTSCWQVSLFGELIYVSFISTQNPERDLTNTDTAIHTWRHFLSSSTTRYVTFSVDLIISKMSTSWLDTMFLCPLWKINT